LASIGCDGEEASTRSAPLPSTWQVASSSAVPPHIPPHRRASSHRPPPGTNRRERKNLAFACRRAKSAKPNPGAQRRLILHQRGPNRLSPVGTLPRAAADGPLCVPRLGPVRCGSQHPGASAASMAGRPSSTATRSRRAQNTNSIHPVNVSPPSEPRRTSLQHDFPSPLDRTRPIRKNGCNKEET
jgi:hypothetical protein